MGIRLPVLQAPVSVRRGQGDRFGGLHEARAPGPGFRLARRVAATWVCLGDVISRGVVPTFAAIPASPRDDVFQMVGVSRLLRCALVALMIGAAL